MSEDINRFRLHGGIGFQQDCTHNDHLTVEAARKLRLSDEQKLIESQSKRISELEERVRKLENYIKDLENYIKDLEMDLNNFNGLPID